MTETIGPPAFPRATYRLQFNADFRFEDAKRIVPYLAELGVSHVYASPVFLARPGSTHGYDMVDHNRLNPEIGDMADFEAFVGELHAHGMGLVLDFVPNHMGVGPDNSWWVDVLEWGKRSPFAGFFDIDWRGADPDLDGKVVLPVLGDHYGMVLENGELQLRFDAADGRFAVAYYESEFPVAPRDYPMLLTKAIQHSDEAARRLVPVLDTHRAGPRRLGRAALRDRHAALKRDLAGVAGEDPAVTQAIEAVLREFNGEPGQVRSFDALHRLLDRQAYRLAYWRIASHEINYRRFFDINELAGLRMERPDLFEACHGLIRQMVERNMIQGLRLDHIDGLRDPKAYLTRLQAMAAAAIRSRGARRRTSRQGNGVKIPAFWTLVEKILAPHEALRRDWPVDGTTGYDFMTQVNGLFVDPRGERSLTRTYDRFIGDVERFETIVLEAKRLIMRETLGSEVSVVANALHHLAKQSRRTRDHSLIACREALIRLISYFPVYRTYVTAKGAGDEDRRDIEWAVGKARKTARGPDTSIYDFLHDVLTLDILKSGRRSYRRQDVLDTTARLQQYTGPVMAKSMEDTAFYRYFRLISLNEVGGEPGHFGLRPAAFHKASQRRAKELPFAMLATATHDHKRGEDVRARLNVLSEIPREWGRRVQRWARLNARKKTAWDGTIIPSPNDEYLFYQTVVGAWPFGMEAPDYDGLEAFRDRIGDYMLKAIREAKAWTSWSAPDEDYERAVTEFVARVLDHHQSRPFLDDLCGFVSRIAAAGAVNGLAQTVLKLTCPGVPDVYQGTEFWDFSLVDPDNRRPVDYGARRSCLRENAELASLLAAWRDGRIKQGVVRRTLDFRRREPELFGAGSYEPVEVTGSGAEHVIAFIRCFRRRHMLVVVPRLPFTMVDETGLPLPCDWGDTRLNLEFGDLTFEDQLGGAAIHTAADLKVSQILSVLPVALFRST